MIRTTSTKLSSLAIMAKPGFREAKAGARAVREANALRTWQDRVLPDLIVAGTQRSGTTSITEALYRLPMVDRPRRGKGSHYFSYNYVRGWPWFQSQFARRKRAAAIEREHGTPLVTFDACPYYLFHPFALERMAHHLPEVKVMVMLRDPVRRAESHYHHSVSHGHETLGIDEAFAAEDQRIRGEVERMAEDPAYWSHAHEHHSYVAKGFYADQLERLFALYPREQVMVFQSGRLLPRAGPPPCRDHGMVGAARGVTQ